MLFLGKAFKTIRWDRNGHVFHRIKNLFIYSVKVVKKKIWRKQRPAWERGREVSENTSMMNVYLCRNMRIIICVSFCAMRVQFDKSFLAVLLCLLLYRGPIYQINFVFKFLA